MVRVKRLFVGGSAGNEQLTAVVAGVLLLLFAIEGATLLRLESLLTVHAFVGMLLIPVVALKLASTGWRMLRYYGRSDEYVRLGPPPLLLRTLVAPVLVLSTLVLFATGVALLVLGQTEGAVVGLVQGELRRLGRSRRGARPRVRPEAAPARGRARAPWPRSPRGPGRRGGRCCRALRATANTSPELIGCRIACRPTSGSTCGSGGRSRVAPVRHVPYQAHTGARLESARE